MKRCFHPRKHRFMGEMGWICFWSGIVKLPPWSARSRRNRKEKICTESGGCGSFAGKRKCRKHTQRAPLTYPSYSTYFFHALKPHITLTAVC
jgi:hypothetical protein